MWSEHLNIKKNEYTVYFYYLKILSTFQDIFSKKLFDSTIATNMGEARRMDTGSWTAWLKP